MENELVSMAQQFTGLPMEDLIGGPLNAAAKANAAMALTQTRFLIETCFDKIETKRVCHREWTDGRENRHVLQAHHD